MNIAILTSAGQWFESYASQLSEKLNGAPIYTNHKDIKQARDIVFILSYHRIIEKKFLIKNKHNIVVHESELPKGKGWAPLFWQVLEGKKEIPFTMFEASDGVDNGDIYFQENLFLTGYELNLELRQKQAELIIKMCLVFVNNYPCYLPATGQEGKESFYRKRLPADSKLDINKTIKEQFNLLRTVNNEEYPAFFEIDGYSYKLRIERSE
jgi:methionyl-tRNA formyltransferase